MLVAFGHLSTWCNLKHHPLKFSRANTPENIFFFFETLFPPKWAKEALKFSTEMFKSDELATVPTAFHETLRGIEF